MAKMKIAPKDRPKVRLECLRLLATLKLDPARSQLIGGFIAAYLKLNAQERKQYEQEFAKLTHEEKEANMERMNPWVKQGWDEGRKEGLQAGIQEGKKEGIQTGIQVGKEELIVRQLNRRFGSVSAQVTERLNRLSSEQLNDIGEALVDFKTYADLEAWLSQHNPQ